MSAGTKRIIKIIFIAGFIILLGYAISQYENISAWRSVSSRDSDISISFTRDGDPVINGRGTLDDNKKRTVYHAGRDSGMTKDEYNAWIAGENASNNRSEKQALYIGCGIAFAGLIIAVALYASRQKAKGE